MTLDEALKRSALYQETYRAALAERWGPLLIRYWHARSEYATARVITLLEEK